jgi:AraC family transcriptional regulator, positive regulator of tynA and feaB
MQKILSTEGMWPSDAFEYWLDVACAKIIEHTAKPLDRHNFFADLKAGSLADISIFTWRMAPTIGCNKRDNDLLLMLPRKCSLEFEFANRCITVDDGNMFLIDMRETHLGRTTQPIEMISLRIPRNSLERRIRLTKEIVNRPITVHGDAALLAGYLHEIIRIGPSQMSPATATIIREHALDLVAVVFGGLAGRQPNLSSPMRVATIKLRAAVESQLASPDADRKSIATAAGVSERHGNRILAQEGTSIRHLLIERRLAKCREALEDPRQQHRSLSDIAYAFGFRQLKHFTNAFMQRYGVSPADYRHNITSVRFETRK